MGLEVYLTIQAVHFVSLDVIRVLTLTVYLSSDKYDWTKLLTIINQPYFLHGRQVHIDT